MISLQDDFCFCAHSELTVLSEPVAIVKQQLILWTSNSTEMAPVAISWGCMDQWISFTSLLDLTGSLWWTCGKSRLRRKSKEMLGDNGQRK